MEKIKNICVVVIVIILLPYVLTVLLNGKSAVKNEKITDSEDLVQVKVGENTEQVDFQVYLAGVLAHQMPVEYDIEALKAQAVMIRTNLYREAGEDGITSHLFTDSYFSYNELENLWDHASFADKYDKLLQAFQDTEGEVLKYKEKYIEAPYHAVSNGKTREGKEALGDKSFTYLQSVECADDVEADEYLDIQVLTREEIVKRCGAKWNDLELNEEDLLKQIQIEEVDSAGYVLKIKLGKKTVSGEEFRTCMELNSSCFTIQEYNNDVRITTKGLGHGLGLSQYSADKMAGKGSDYKEILSEFYKDTKIEKIDQ